MHSLDFSKTLSVPWHGVCECMCSSRSVRIPQLPTSHDTPEKYDGTGNARQRANDGSLLPHQSLNKERERVENDSPCSEKLGETRVGREEGKKAAKSCGGGRGAASPNDTKSDFFGQFLLTVSAQTRGNEVNKRRR